MDTSVEASALSGFYYRIEPVRQINSPADEWQLAFYEPRRAAITYTDGDLNRMMIVRMIRPERFSMESGIYVPMVGHVGALSISGTNAAFAAVPTETEKERGTGDYSAADDIEYIHMPNEHITGNSNIYYADYADKQLRNVEYLGRGVHQNIFSWESQPALSPEGNLIIYASDRDSSIGGVDLWMTIHMKNGEWSHPINMGENVNSRCDEITPYFTPDGKELYFSSDGMETVGGYDIFVCNVKEAFWAAARTREPEAFADIDDMIEAPKNMRAPLNTKYDEIFPSSPGNPDSIFYYSSDQRAETASMVAMAGGFDLFVRHKIYTKEIEPEVAEREDVDIAFDVEPDMPQTETTAPVISPTFKLQGTVYNKKTNRPVPNAEITVKEMPSATVVDSTRSDKQGNYEVGLEKDREFEVTAQAEDLFFDSFKIRVDKDDPVTEVKKEFAIPEKLTLRINFPTDEYKNPYRYTLDSNGVETGRSWQEELNTLAENILKSKENVEKIVLKGHTDDVASVAYNKQLGQRRVDFIIKELVKRGVPREILEGQSAGELEPLDRRPGEKLSMFRKRLRRVTLEKIQK